MELISLSFVLVEEPSLKNDGCDDECLSKESDECHMFLNLIKRVIFNIDFYYDTNSTLNPLENILYDHGNV